MGTPMAPVATTTTKALDGSVASGRSFAFHRNATFIGLQHLAQISGSIDSAETRPENQNFTWILAHDVGSNLP